jgi:flagellar protein FlgJ
MSEADFLMAKTQAARQDAMAGAPFGNLQGRKKMTDAQAEKAAEDFESMFLSQMLAPMWQGIETDGMFGGGSAEETFRGMLMNEYGKVVSKAGGLGIASAVKTELLRMQENQNAAA